MLDNKTTQRHNLRFQMLDGKRRFERIFILSTKLILIFRRMNPTLNNSCLFMVAGFIKCFNVIKPNQYSHVLYVLSISSHVVIHR